MAFQKKKELNSLRETENFAKELSEKFTNGDVVVFNGDLGSGKTTLIKFISSYYGIDNTISP
ncbi:MAG: tRNA (adenosine(37)-N6)-threonylcarbamoyltransferase complex ATPase subunit type 1 TsaE, partial [Melioribacteraceae bacterium]|nr:tRNA (adenosine(37)-N6)-threonylcarbamoyltransferase complex ATPase subunit type 1 TsaE [Melioribacteraceae bacterium]